MIFLVIISCHIPKNDTKKQNNIIEKIQIKATDLGILTIIDINCDKFENAFDDHINYYITDTAEINEFMNQITELQPLDSGNWSVDTRAKIILYSANDTNTICVGLNFLNYNNKFYDTSQWLIDYIENLVNEYYYSNKQITQ